MDKLSLAPDLTWVASLSHLRGASADSYQALVHHNDVWFLLEAYHAEAEIQRVLLRFQCFDCRGSMYARADGLYCGECGKTYPNIPLRPGVVIRDEVQSRWIQNQREWVQTLEDWLCLRYDLLTASLMATSLMGMDLTLPTEDLPVFGGFASVEGYVRELLRLK